MRKMLQVWQRAAGAAVVSAGVALMPGVARGDFYVTQAGGNGTIADYTETGTLVNGSVATGFQMFGPQALAVSGTLLYVVSGDVGSNGTVGVYTTSGAVVNASLITGLNDPMGIALSGSAIYVTSYDGGTIGDYDMSGHAINANLVSGLNGPAGIALSGNVMYVGILGSNTISEYTTSGGVVNASLIHTGSLAPFQVELSGSDLFILNEVAGVVEEYTTAGDVVNATLISGLTFSNHIPTGMAVDGSNLFIARPTASGYVISEYTTSGILENADLFSVGGGPIAVAPEPGSISLLALGAMGLLRRRRRRG